MQFNTSREAIYLQIVDFVCEKILLGEYQPEEKLPSVRELAIQLEVNPNTVMRAYEVLKQQQIIHDRRGTGFFLVFRHTQYIVPAFYFCRKRQHKCSRNKDQVGQ